MERARFIFWHFVLSPDPPFMADGTEPQRKGAQKGFIHVLRIRLAILNSRKGHQIKMILSCLLLIKMDQKQTRSLIPFFFTFYFFL